MKNIVFIFIALSIVGIVNAQNNNKDSVTCKISVDITGVNSLLINDRKIKDKAIELTTMDSMQSIVSLLKTKFNDAKEFLQTKGIILEAYTAPQKPKWDPEIDKFLNIEDISIFMSNFKKYEPQEVHPSRRNHYQVVEKVHDLNEKLQGIKNDLLETSIAGVAKNYNISKESAEANSRDAAKKQLKNVETILSELENMDKSVLSPEQRNYYDLLNEDYERFIDQLYN